MVVKFKLDIERAIASLIDMYKNQNTDGKYFINKLDAQTLKILQDNENPVPLLNTHIIRIHDSKLMPSIILSDMALWESIEKEYIERMENITKRKFNNSKIICYLIISQKCRYNPNDRSFMLNIFDNPFSKMLGIGHELFHLHFHEHFFDNVENILGNKITHDLKEALTVLLNLEFNDLWFLRDAGYPQHQELRKFITETWLKEKDFEKLMDKCIKYLLFNQKEVQSK